MNNLHINVLKSVNKIINITIILIKIIALKNVKITKILKKQITIIIVNKIVKNNKNMFKIILVFLNVQINTRYNKMILFAAILVIINLLLMDSIKMNKQNYQMFVFKMRNVNNNISKLNKINVFNVYISVKIIQNIVKNYYNVQKTKVTVKMIK